MSHLDEAQTLPHSHTSYDVVFECPDCGLFSRLVAPVAGMDQRCLQCAKVLRRVRDKPLEAALAWTLAGLAFYLIAVSSPLLQVILYGRSRFSTLATGPFALDDQNLWMLATLVIMTTILMPLLKLIGTLIVLGGLRMEKPPSGLPLLFGWLKHLNHWVMVEVYMLGFLVAYTRLLALMSVHLGVASYATFGLMLSIIGLDAALDPEAVWERMEERGLIKSSTLTTKSLSSSPNNLIGCDTCHQVGYIREGDDCPRCGDVIRVRKPNSLSRGWALVFTAALLYVPSNMVPIMSVTKFGKTQSYTIFAGMMELIHIGLWPLGVLVFVASIVIPSFKLIALSTLMWQTGRGSTWRLRDRTRLYRLLDFIGRWSMVDVFMVSILVALVRFGKLALVQANWGVVYFGAVVILTMLAVSSFDPRLMWDNLNSPRAAKSADNTIKGAMA